ncbi:response regulator [Pseudoalteromonas piscicida]|uniref:Response regulator n=1 Tax=Pseudoalteromonas piscicida TaxID=43662 RepID=A0A2A5JSL3_PSEO7|nr:response regulator [Pseudoalteromonas piscicida]PCK32329.1 response regulator [Pseudoalteromonas piscicida]
MNLEVSTSARYKVLILDDEVSILNALKRVFQQSELDVACFDDPFAALEFLDNHAVQVIISDFRMPKMDGGEFLKQAKKRNPAAVGLILSGYTDSEMLINMINTKVAHRFLCKPWQNEQLLQEVYSAIDTYKAHYFQNVIQAQLKKHDCPRVLINSDGQVLEHNLNKDIAPQIVEEFSVCFSGNGVFATPFGTLRCDIANSPEAPELYLITINKVEVANSIDLYQTINELLLCYTINPEIARFTIANKETMLPKLTVAAQQVFRHFQILPSSTQYYLFVLDKIEQAQLQRKLIELEIQVEKMVEGTLSNEITCNQESLSSFFDSGA